MNTARAIGYVRVSTEEQAAEGVSIEAQRNRIAAWCALNNYDLAEVFVDAGLSGKRADNRPALQAALSAAKSGGALVVYSLSRLARSTKDTIAIGERLEKSGADLVSLSEKIDTTTAAGKMVFRMLAVMAEFERDVIAERTTMAMRHKRAQGERVGRIPFGFDLGMDGVTLKRNESEQRILGTVAELRRGGMTLRGIAQELTNRGIPTKSGATKWTHSTIQRLTRAAA
jgi:site-specific DNA recombinase